MADSRSSCRTSSERSEKKSLTTFVPVVGDVICEGPGVIYISIDPDVWRIRCQQCQQKTEHKCSLKKLKNKFRAKSDSSRRRFESDVEESENAKLALIGEGLSEDGKGKDGKLEATSAQVNGKEELEGEEGVCMCPDRPGNKKPTKPNTCLCNPYLPVNFLLEIQVTGEPKQESVLKKKKQRE